MKIRMGFVLFFFSLLFSCDLSGQIINVTREGIEIADVSGLNKDIDYTEIKGTPYYHNDYKRGKVLFRNGEEQNFLMRYNIYQDVIEYQQDESFLLLGWSEFYEAIIIDGEKFVMRYFKDGPETNRGYFVQLTDSGLQVYKRMQVGYRDESDRDSGYEIKRNRACVRSKDLYYMAIGKDILKVFTGSKNSLKQFVAQDADRIFKYAKKNKLNLKKEEDLVALMELYRQGEL
ncbi:MAG: hypothetical protein OEX02_02100 [Cyclobacteriaceae bacterium]|nr:hypothetical protein [Cyclobacteriaceae bacterium]